MPGAEMAKEPPPAKRSTSRLGMYGLLMGYIFSIKVPSPPPPPQAWGRSWVVSVAATAGCSLLTEWLLDSAAADPGLPPQVPRFAIPSLIPFMVADLGLSSAAVPTLLAAFHPGAALTILAHHRLLPSPALSPVSHADDAGANDSGADSQATSRR